ncbi:MAG: hypothetical protein RJA61_359 [Candidatus Parcubacteria bacterium]|jgi:hypothetical protein
MTKSLNLFQLVFSGQKSRIDSGNTTKGGSMFSKLLNRLFGAQVRAQDKLQDILIEFSKIPIGQWYSINIRGKPGKAITKKRSHDGTGRSIDRVQLVKISPNKKVWWRQSFVPEK